MGEEWKVWLQGEVASTKCTCNSFTKVKSCTLLLICQDACWEGAICSLQLCLTRPRFYISSYREELFSTSPFAAFLHECRLDPVQGRCQKSTYLWVENLDRLAVENDPASEGWREQYPSHHPLKGNKTSAGEGVCMCTIGIKQRSLSWNANRAESLS